MFFILTFSVICIQFAIGQGGGGSSSGTTPRRSVRIQNRQSRGGQGGGGQGEGFPIDINSNEQKSYKVSVLTLRYDGGSVLVLKEGYGYEEGSIHHIEKILKKVLGIKNVTYLEEGKVRYNGQSMPIEELVRLVNLNTSIFEPLFDGHVIALFYLNNQETFRIHLRSKGLNFYDSKRKASYFVKKYEDKTKENFGDLYLELDTKKEAKKRETSYTENFIYKETSDGPEIETEVYTRPLSLKQLINIAYRQVSEGRTSNDKSFKCRHFVYELIRAITDPSFLDLSIYESWPKGIRSLDEFLAGNGVKAFEQVTNNYEDKYQNFKVSNALYKTPIHFPNQ